MLTDAPYLVVEQCLARARVTYAKHAVAWTVIGLPAAALSAATFSSATRVSGMLGGVAFALPVGIWMAARFFQMRKGGPLLRLVREEPSRIVWHFVRQHSVHSRGGAEIRRTYEMALGRDDGKRFTFVIEESWVERVKEALGELAPHATEGWSETNEDLFADDPKAMLKVRAPEGGAYRDAPGDAKPVVRGRRQRARRVRNRVLVGVPAVLLVLQLVGALVVTTQLRARTEARRAKLDALFATADRQRAAARARVTADGPPSTPVEEACRERITLPVSAYIPTFVHTDGEIREYDASGQVRAVFSHREVGQRVARALGPSPSFGYFFGRAFFRGAWDWGRLLESYGHDDDIPPDAVLAVPLLTPLAADRMDDPRSVDVDVVRANGELVCRGTVAIPTKVRVPTGSDPCALALRLPTAGLDALCRQSLAMDRVERLEEGLVEALTRAALP